MITVLNGSHRVIAMRLSLEQPSVWWDLQAVPPCQKIEVPPVLLKMSMSEAVPRATVKDIDLNRLRLEFMDSRGKNVDTRRGRPAPPVRGLGAVTDLCPYGQPGAMERQKIEKDLIFRRKRAEEEQWLGEIEGVDMTLAFVRTKQADAARLGQRSPVALGIPTARAPSG